MLTDEACSVERLIEGDKSLKEGKLVSVVTGGFFFRVGLITFNITQVPLTIER